jgi:glycine betaine catabolism B
MDQYGPWQLRLADKRREYGNTYTFAFEPLSPFSFQAGQYLHLTATPERGDKSMTRHMSIASPPASRHVEFTMDLGSGTDYKRAMAALKTGDLVTAFKLKGEFLVEPASSSPVVLLAGGLGITPIRSILRDLAAAGSQVPRSLFHVARDAHLFEEELSGMGFPQWRTDRLGLDALWQKALDMGGAEGKYYLCGSERFILGMQARLLNDGVAFERIVVENFR